MDGSVDWKLAILRMQGCGDAHLGKFTPDDQSRRSQRWRTMPCIIMVIFKTLESNVALVVCPLVVLGKNGKHDSGTRT